MVCSTEEGGGEIDKSNEIEASKKQFDNDMERE